MSVERKKVSNDALNAYGDTRGTGWYHRDPKTGAISDGFRNSKRSAYSTVASKASTGHKVRAIDLYDREMEPEGWDNVPKQEPELNLPKITAEPYKSKFHTTYEPKTHYRFHDAYGLHVEEDPLVKQFLEDEKPQSGPEPQPVPTPTPKPKPPSPPKRDQTPSVPPPPNPEPKKEAPTTKKKARPRRPQSPAKAEYVSDEDEKREFVKWVTNGKGDDLGISERLLFKRRGN